MDLITVIDNTSIPLWRINNNHNARWYQCNLLESRAENFSTTHLPTSTTSTHTWSSLTEHYGYWLTPTLICPDDVIHGWIDKRCSCMPPLWFTIVADFSFCNTDWMYETAYHDGGRDYNMDDNMIMNMDGNINMDRNINMDVNTNTTWTWNHVWIQVELSL